MKRALITGFAGFVGRHFTRHLLDTGWHVTGVDNMVSGVHQTEWSFPPKSIARLDTMYWDIKNYAFQKDPDFDLIIHCAAIVGGRLTIDNDPLKVATDLAIDAEFFNWLAKYQRKDQKVVYFSSSAVYPVTLQGTARLALSESFMSFDRREIGMPDMTYGWSKLTGEYLAKMAVEKYGLDVVIYRPFSGYGEDQDFAYPFPSIIRRIVNREDPITIWGSGNQTRDFIHIDDVVDAVMATMYELKPGEALNLGSGKGTSFKELVQVAIANERPTRFVDIAVDTTKPEGVFYRVANIDKLSLMYTPMVSLQEGIARVAAHLTKQKVQDS